MRKKNRYFFGQQIEIRDFQNPYLSTIYSRFKEKMGVIL